MKSCLHCKYAEWERRDGGNLHPSGGGKCKYPYKIPQLPASMWFVGFPPRIMIGRISRKEELKDHCAYFVHER